MSDHTTRRRWIRRGTITLGFFLAAVLGIAAALFFGKAPIDGGAQSDAFTARWDKSTGGSNNVGGATCTYEADDNGKLTLNVTKAYPGTHCEVGGRVQLASGASEPGEVVGVDLTLPDGWTAKLVKGCGEQVSQFQPGPGQGTDVQLRVTMGEQAQPGSASTFKTGDGVTVAPVSQDAPLACTP